MNADAAPSPAVRDRRHRLRILFSRQWHPELGFGSTVLLSVPLLALLLIFVAYPIFLLLLPLLQEDGLNHFAQFFQSRASVQALEYTIWESAAVTVGTILLSAPLAWTLRMPGSVFYRAIIWVAVLAPLWMNVVVKTYAFIIVLGRNGIVSEAAQVLGLASGPIDILYTPTAVVIGMLHAMLPYGVLPLFVTFSTIDLDLLKAAESLGASRAGAIFSVALPLSIVGLLATATIVFVVCLGFYVTPVILGGARSPYISTLVQGDLIMRFDSAAASTDSAILILAAGIVLALMSWLLGGKHLKRALG